MMCERCFEDYEEGEYSRPDFFEGILCIPCQYEYKRRLKNMRIHFMNTTDHCDNQPERLNETDHIVGVNKMVCDSLNTANK